MAMKWAYLSRRLGGTQLTHLGSLVAGAQVQELIILLNRDSWHGSGLLLQLWRRLTDGGIGRGFNRPRSQWFGSVHDWLCKAGMSLQMVLDTVLVNGVVVELHHNGQEDGDGWLWKVGGVAAPDEEAVACCTIRDCDSIVAFGDGSKAPSEAPIGVGVVVFESPDNVGGEALLETATGGRRYGGLERSNNTAEGLALLEVARAVHPGTDIWYITDSAVTLRRFTKVTGLRNPSAREWVKMGDRWLWMELRAYARERAQYGSEFKVTKCWSHVGDRADGKGLEQEEWITTGNNLADAQANKGRADCGDVDHGSSAFQLDFSLVDATGLVDLAPRRAIRQAFEQQQLEAGRADQTQGALLRILDSLDAQAMRGCTEQSSGQNGLLGSGTAMPSPWGCGKECCRRPPNWDTATRRKRGWNAPGIGARTGARYALCATRKYLAMCCTAWGNAAAQQWHAR